jgi:hypothetical protein
MINKNSAAKHRFTCLSFPACTGRTGSTKRAAAGKGFSEPHAQIKTSKKPYKSNTGKIRDSAIGCTSRELQIVPPYAATRKRGIAQGQNSAALLFRSICMTALILF